jgi:hypothetical protein
VCRVIEASASPATLGTSPSEDLVLISVTTSGVFPTIPTARFQEKITPIEGVFRR